MNLELRDGVHVLTLTNNAEENTFTLDVLDEYLEAFKQVEEYKGNTSLLITCEDPKTFTNGINLKWYMGGIASAEEREAFPDRIDKVLVQLATLNCPTVVCMNGNTYAGGAILASSADFRIMRSDRGRLCFPEVNINIPFRPKMHTILDMYYNQQVLKEMMLLGVPKTGQECLEAGIVDYLYPLETLQEEAFKFAKTLKTKNRTTYTTIKHGLRHKVFVYRDEYGFENYVQQ
jgi:enoyl-CoA hydratase/carnithine racemase